VCIGGRLAEFVLAQLSGAHDALGGEQRRKVLELLAPPPSRHDHSDGGIPRQSRKALELLAPPLGRSPNGKAA
jgi:hypothetical protein